jgi:hypothetical protein
MYVRNNNLLDQMLFSHLTQYWRLNTEVDITRIQKGLLSSADIKFKFAIQVRKGIKSATEVVERSYWDRAWITYWIPDIHSTRFRWGYSKKSSENPLPCGFWSQIWYKTQSKTSCRWSLYNKSPRVYLSSLSVDRKMETKEIWLITSQDRRIWSLGHGLFGPGGRLIQSTFWENYY